VLYFAYGSNMHRAGMAVPCPEAKPMGAARLPDYRFRINRRGVATVVPEPGATVHGILWSVNDDCLRALDRFEGVARGFYRRLTRRVTTSDHDSKNAFLYLAADAERGRAPWAYLDLLLKVAREAEFPPEYVAELEQWG